mmetsp:Transcript_32581/g.97223  ORF Transcript_32581/g.97223 Transcript_32581/m.97223 type:complete len:226 (-) Transcript_32581:51-728(-)
MSDQDAWGFEEDLDMAAQKNPEAGWLVDDVLVLKFVIRVKQKVEYSLSDKMPSDLTLKLPSGGKLPAFWQLLRFASDDFLNAPGGDTMPVDGSLCAWTYIPMWLHPQHDEPDLTLGGAYVLLPVAHKYGFSKLVDRVVGFVRSHALIDVHSVYINYAIYWLALSEDLQLDELRDFCWSVKGGWSCEKVAACLRGGGCKDSMPHEVRQLSKEAICKLLELMAWAHK